MDFSSDARRDVIDSISGNMKSVMELVRAKGIIENTPNTGPDVQRAIQTNLGIVDAWYKYPETIGELGVGMGIVELISLDAQGIQVFPENRTNPNCYSIRVGYDELTCYVEYTEACDIDTPAAVQAVTTGC